MDATSAKGLEVRDEVEEVIERLEKKWDSLFVQFSNESPVRFDGMIIEDRNIGAIFEFKCRDVSVRDSQLFYKGKGYDTIILTQEKIDHGVNYSKQFRVPFLFIFYARKSGSVHCIQITNSKGEYLFNYKVENSVTKATINGGRAMRVNAYLPINQAKQWI